jgi:Ca2+-binding RTX toxin-like protein
MTQVTNPTTQPQSSNPNAGGGLDIVGVQGDNRLNGSVGADFINTFGANDQISGGGGNDLIITGGGNDTVGGGDGNDSVYAGSGNDVVAGGSGADQLFGGKGADLVNGFDGDDLIAGNQGTDTLLGLGGNDTVYGNESNDVVSGGDGNDVLYGGKEGDTVEGGSGNDFISGDRGADVLTGGAGSDTFYFFSSGGDCGCGVDGVDTITDFTPTEDKIGLKSGGAFGGLGNTLDASEFVVVNNFTPGNQTANTANKLIYDPTSGLLYYNSGSQVLTVAQLSTGLTITSGNFELF